jgi:hypothetical protein
MWITSFRLSVLFFPPQAGSVPRLHLVRHPVPA